MEINFNICSHVGFGDHSGGPRLGLFHNDHRPSQIHERRPQVQRVPEWSLVFRTLYSHVAHLDYVWMGVRFLSKT